MYSECIKRTPKSNKKQNRQSNWKNGQKTIISSEKVHKWPRNAHKAARALPACGGAVRERTGSSKFLPPPLPTPDGDNQNQRPQGAEPPEAHTGRGMTTVSTTTSGRTLSIPWQCYAFEHTQKKCVHICTKKQVRTFRSAFVKPRDNSDTHEQQKE